MSNELLILVTNDDGVRADGLKSLIRALAPLGRVVCVAPDREQSAASHAITLRHPLRMTELGPDLVSVEGTPTDCVLLAVHGVLKERSPDLIVSGINNGPNLGDDVNYSGTVAAAVEGHRLGIPAIAVSLGREETRDLEHAGQITACLVGRLLALEAIGPRAVEASVGVPSGPAAGELGASIGRNGDGLLLNVNVPGRPREAIHGFAVTRLGKRVYRDIVVSKVDPYGRPYYWIGGEAPIWERGAGHEETDFAAIEAGRVSITPLRLDRTDHEGIRRVASWDLEGLTLDRER
jgi:5'-nucleotidase